jgi:hypothetical protein
LQDDSDGSLAPAEQLSAQVQQQQQQQRLGHFTSLLQQAFQTQQAPAGLQLPRSGSLQAPQQQQQQMAQTSTFSVDTARQQQLLKRPLQSLLLQIMWHIPWNSEAGSC